MPLNCTLKVVNFMLYVFSHPKPSPLPSQTDAVTKNSDVVQGHDLSTWAHTHTHTYTHTHTRKETRS